jgi:hypothetical protein
MATESEIRAEIATERRELTNAVADLREELSHTAERGKKVGAAVGAATGALLAVRTVLRLRRRSSDER